MGGGGRGSKDPAGCGVVIRGEEGLDPRGDVRVASSPLPSSPLSLHTSPLPFFLQLSFSPTLFYSSLSSTFLRSAPLLPGLWPVPSGAEYPSGFRSCLAGVSQLLRRGEEGGGGLRCPLVHEHTVDSTMDSVSPSSEAPTLCGPCVPVVWAPVLAAGGSRSPPPRLLLPRGLPRPRGPPGLCIGVPAPQPVSRHCAESPGPGLRLWRPW